MSRIVLSSVLGTVTLRTQPNNDYATRVERITTTFICCFFFSRIQELSSKLDALTQFSARLLLIPLKPLAATSWAARRSP